MKISREVLDKIFQHLNKEELGQLALDLGAIRGPQGYEEEAGEYVYQWMKKNGLNPTKQFVSDQRFNVIGVIPGAGNGNNLAFNSHLDVAFLFEGEPQAGKENTSAYGSWAEGDRLYGRGVMNCRGPMSIWLVMAKAMKESGIKLGGDLVLTAVVGEIGGAPVDEYQGSRFMGGGFGSEHAVRYGPPVDYALVAETTDFGVTWAECGIAYLRIVTRGRRIYSPRLKEYKDIKEHPNAIVKMFQVGQAIEGWARKYEAKSITEFPGGVIKPKVNIGGIRGGYPPWPSMSADLCSVFISVRLLPGEGPLRVMRELKEVISKTGLDVEVSCYSWKKGYIGQNVGPLVEAIEESYQELYREKLPEVSSEVTSMWRDVNIYSGAGIPAVTFGPKRYDDEKITPKYGIKYLLKDDLVKAARLYAMTALKICSFNE